MIHNNVNRGKFDRDKLSNIIGSVWELTGFQERIFILPINKQEPCLVDRALV
jgi:hypothetical protein